jgi:cytochrome b
VVRVWDIFVRVSHWAVAAGFFVAYFTEDNLLLLHVWAGYLVGVLVVLRLLWGVVGPKHARFTDFVCGPRRAAGYLLDLFRFRAPRYLGHSPAGGAMAVVLWAGMLVVVWSGLEFYAIEEGAGPLAAASGESTAAAPETAQLVLVSEEAEGGEGRGSLWEAVHEAGAEILFVLVLLHIAGVALASLMHRENLVRSMVNGMKRPGPDQTP